MAERCFFCGSDRVVENTTIREEGQGGRSRPLAGLVGAVAPDSWWDKQAVEVIFRADICCSCGRAVLRVEDPAGLWEKFARMPPQKRP